MARKLLLFATLAACLSLPAAAPASTAPPVVVAMIDTGVYPWHHAFDYRGPDSLDDQFVGWWDFTDDSGPARDPQPGQTWDTRVRDPWDVQGHGTATASMAVGQNSYWGDPAYAPGFKLAVAKVASYNGITGSIASAIRWAVDTVHANVVNISIGSTRPATAADAADVYAALRHARQSGVLVCVANGNGYLNYGLVPGDPGWANWFGSSTDVLSVGAAGTQGALESTDPEVAARYTVYAACDWYSQCYEEISGTSFASPTVAGMAAYAMQTAADYGRNVSVDWIERLLKYSATDTAMPPSFEGYGVLDDLSFWSNVVEGARTGRLPARPTVDVNAAYVDGGGATLRDSWSNKAGRSFTAVGPSPTSSYEIGPSTPTLCDAEVYGISLKAGERVTMYFWFGSTADVDVRMYPRGPFDDSRLVASSRNAPGQPEFIEYTSPTGGDYFVFVHGYTVATPVSLDVYSYSTSRETPELRYVSQGTYAATLP